MFVFYYCWEVLARMHGDNDKVMIKQSSIASRQGAKELSSQVNCSKYCAGLIIGILTLVISSSFILWKLKSELSELAGEALFRIDHYIEQTAISLEPLVSAELPCNRNDVSLLRKTVFRSAHVKEIGLINRNNTVYCTSFLGPTSIRLYSSTVKRWANSPNGRTVSLTRSKTGSAISFFVYIRGENGIGANALIPPYVLDTLVARGMPYPELPFIVKVIGKPFISSHNEYLDWDAKSQWEIVSFSSSQNPIELQFQLTRGFLLSYLTEHYWVFLLTGSLLSLLCAYFNHRKTVRQSLPATFEWALTHHELEVYFQPIVDTRQHQPLGFELLLRWHHPEHGMISPLIFIPLAEQLGKISALTDFVLDTAIEFIRVNPALVESRYLSVNISRHSLLEEGFAERFCRRCGVDKKVTNHLLLEITEELAFSEQEMTMVIAQLEQLKAHGFRIAVDDFGTGYSGLDLIRRFPFDVVKIDKVFIKDLREDESVIPLLDSMIGLARRLGMTIIAEGVETAQQADRLLKWGVYAHQGFYYAKPMSQRSLISWLERKRQEYESKALLSGALAIDDVGSNRLR